MCSFARSRGGGVVGDSFSFALNIIDYVCGRLTRPQLPIPTAAEKSAAALRLTSYVFTGYMPFPRLIGAVAIYGGTMTQHKGDDFRSLCGKFVQQTVYVGVCILLLYLTLKDLHLLLNQRAWAVAFQG